MPLILDAGTHPIERLREMLRENQADFRETLAALDHPPGPVLDPMGLKNAGDLVRGVMALGDAIDRPEAEPKLLAAMVNVQYETLVASIDLMKAHVDIPKVPRSRK